MRGSRICCVPEWVILSNAPVALRCTRMSFDLARRIRGPKAPERAILALFSSCVARLVIQPTALHCTSTLGDIIWRIRGASPPRATIKTLFSAEGGELAIEIELDAVKPESYR